MNRMRMTKIAGISAALLALTACERTLGTDNTVDFNNIDGGVLIDGRANIWIDPDGCQHWYIDDGVEGYMTPRLQRNGRPVCRPRTESELNRAEGALGSLPRFEEEDAPAET